MMIWGRKRLEDIGRCVLPLSKWWDVGLRIWVNQDYRCFYCQKKLWDPLLFGITMIRLYVRHHVDQFDRNTVIACDECHREEHKFDLFLPPFDHTPSFVKEKIEKVINYYWTD